MMDVCPFSAIAVGGSSLVMSEQNTFQRNAALGAQEGRWAVLRICFVVISIYVRFADMPFIRYKQEASNCCRF